MSMVTHPHAKPKSVTVKDCTHVMSQLRIVKGPEEIERIRAAATGEKGRNLSEDSRNLGSLAGVSLPGVNS